jgi:transcription elongation factor
VLTARQGRKAEVKHIFKAAAFLHAKDYMENAGMLMARTRQLQLVTARDTKACALSHCCTSVSRVSSSLILCCFVLSFRLRVTSANVW